MDTISIRSTGLIWLKSKLEPSAVCEGEAANSPLSSWSRLQLFFKSLIYFELANSIQSTASAALNYIPLRARYTSRLLQDTWIACRR